MKITVKQLKQLIREQVEEAQSALIDLDQLDGYGSGGSGNKKHEVVLVFKLTNDGPQVVKTEHKKTVSQVLDMVKNVDGGDAEIGNGYELLTLERDGEAVGLIVGATDKNIAMRAATNWEPAF